MDTSCALALGFFDGVHIGHGALLRETREQAQRLGCRAAALSFDAHPSSLLSATQPPLLAAMEERKLLMQRFYGIDEVLFAHFDRAMMQMPWDVFFAQYLVQQLRARVVVCGHDYRCGRGGEGTPELLQQACAAHGIGCVVVPQVTLDGVRVSSTHIRTLLERGEMEQATRFLGHPHLISGTVVHGQALGRTIGFPTANVPLTPGVLVPPYGVYAAQAECDGITRPAVVNIGLHPTAGSLPAPLLEANLLDFDGALYGTTLRVWLYRRLRPEQKFDSLASLRTQIAADAANTKAFFAATPD